MSINSKMITTVDEVAHLSADATIFVNESGKLKQAKATLFASAFGGFDYAALHFRGVLTALPTNTSEYIDGDVIIVGAKEYVMYSGAWYEFGDTSVSGVGDIEEITTDEISDIFGTLSP